MIWEFFGFKLLENIEIQLDVLAYQNSVHDGTFSDEFWLSKECKPYSSGDQ